MSERLTIGARVERSLSLLVGLAAIVAAMVSLYQASLAREQARAAAWPYLSGGSSFSEKTPYFYVLANRGIGPARIRTAEVLVDGKPVDTWTTAITMLTGAKPTAYDYSYVGTGSVMSPNSADTLLTIPNGTQAFTFWKAAGKRLAVKLCYCSVYDECWTTGTESLENVSVKNCPPVTGTAFTQ